MAYQFKREPLTRAEADRLANACRTKEERLIVFTLLDTGLRVDELAKLTGDNIQWQQRCLRVQGKAGVFGGGGKGEKRWRVVPLQEERTRELLHAYFAINDKWFCGPRYMQRVVKDVANRAKIVRKVSPHVLRHTFASLALQDKVSLASVKKALGHARLETTAIYLNFTDEHMLEEFDPKRRYRD